MRYRHTPEMGEISGFGGGYEETCQNMLETGVGWLMDNPDKREKIKVYVHPGVYGVVGLREEGNDDPDPTAAEELSDFIESVTEDCTGAMHQAVMTRLNWIAVHGWEKYVRALESRGSESEENE